MDAQISPMFWIDFQVPVTRVKVISAEPRPGFHDIRNVTVILQPDLPFGEVRIQAATAIYNEAFLFAEKIKEAHT